MIDLKKIQKTDPVKRNVDKGLEHVEHSPMDPPSAYEQPGVIEQKTVLEKPIQVLVDEHKTALLQIDLFEKALVAFKTGKYVLTQEINQVFADFFKYFDNELLPHNDKEEKYLFPILHKRLIEAGEHSTGEIPMTAINVMEDDHVKFIQLGTLTFNLLGLATRLKDAASRIFVQDTAYENGRELIELLKLHIYREDHTLFPLAKKYMTPEEFREVEKQMHLD
jgi:hemerythrin-like domain-containing protein